MGKTVHKPTPKPVGGCNWVKEDTLPKHKEEDKHVCHYNQGQAKAWGTWLHFTIVIKALMGTLIQHGVNVDQYQIGVGLDLRHKVESGSKKFSYTMRLSCKEENTREISIEQNKIVWLDRTDGSKTIEFKSGRICTDEKSLSDTKNKGKSIIYCVAIQVFTRLSVRSQPKLVMQVKGQGFKIMSKPKKKNDVSILQITEADAEKILGMLGPHPKIQARTRCLLYKRMTTSGKGKKKC
eukprot:UN24399